MTSRFAVLWAPIVILGCEGPPAPPAPSSASVTLPKKGPPPTPTGAPTTADLQTARALVREFGGALKKELMNGIRAGGPTSAIAMCADKAPTIGAAVAPKGWTVRRTSSKLRNPSNTPDAWEKRMLEKMEADKSGGTPVSELEVSEVVDGEFRYMKAIETAGVCVTCHGAEIAPDVHRALIAAYPNDAARGFAVGDIRGAFTLRKKL